MAIVLEEKRVFDNDEAIDVVNQADLSEMVAAFLVNQLPRLFNRGDHFRFWSDLRVYYTPGIGLTQHFTPYQSIAKTSVNLNRTRRKDILASIEETFLFIRKHLTNETKEECIEEMVSQPTPEFTTILQYIEEKLKPAMKKALTVYGNSVLDQKLPEEQMYHLDHFDRYDVYQSIIKEPLFRMTDADAAYLMIDYLQTYPDKACELIDTDKQIKKLFSAIDIIRPMDREGLLSEKELAELLIDHGKTEWMVRYIDDHNKKRHHQYHREFQVSDWMTEISQPYRHQLLDQMISHHTSFYDDHAHTYYKGFLDTFNQEHIPIIKVIKPDVLNKSYFEYIYLRSKHDGQTADMVVFDIEKEDAYLLLSGISEVASQDGSILGNYSHIMNDYLCYTDRAIDLIKGVVTDIKAILNKKETKQEIIDRLDDYLNHVEGHRYQEPVGEVLVIYQKK